MTDDANSTALATRANEITRVTEAAHRAFSQEQLDIIRRNVAPEADDNTFLWFASVAARYELNPLSHELYLAKMPGKDGAPPRWTIIVGKHGMLRIADRHPDYEGFDGDFVCEKDVFEVRHTSTGPEVNHPWHTQKAEGSDESARGPIIGAWAIAYRRGRRPRFVFAPMSEYMDERSRAWKRYGSSMIRKVAIAQALREQFSLSGLYDQAEMAHVIDVEGGAVEIQEAIEWGDEEDASLAETLRHLIGEMNRLRPGSYREPKVRTLLAGADHAAREQLAAHLKQEVQDAGGAVTPRESESEISDAEVVEEPVVPASSQPPPEVVEPEPAVEDAKAETMALTPEQQEEIDSLTHQLADIDTALEAAATDAERDELLAEANELQARLDELSGPS